MIDELKLKIMRDKPTMDDIASPHKGEKAILAIRVAMRRAKKDQDKVIKEATRSRVTRSN